jgi:hypothetical protein
MNPSLVGKLSYLTSKNRLKLTQVTRNCATQGVLQHSSHVESQPHRGKFNYAFYLQGYPPYCEPMSKGKLVIFPWLESAASYWRKRMNFPFDIDSKRHF